MSLLSHQAKEFLIRECASCEVAGHHLAIADVGEIVDLFSLFLAYPVSDSRLAGLAQKVISQLEAISSAAANRDTFTNAVNQLAPAFESYLKKLGCLVYEGDNQRLNGDLQYVGIMELTLGKLLEGRLAKRNKGGPALPDLSVRLVPFSYTPATAEEHLYGFIREVRNDVHESRSFALAETTRRQNATLFCFLHSLQKNLIAIRPAIDPMFHRLAASKLDWESAVTFYIPNQSSEWRLAEDNTLEALLATSWSDTNRNGKSFELSSIDSSLRFAVTDLALKTSRFWLTGEPGSGKSTSLRRIAADLADSILTAGKINVPVPCFVLASIVSPEFCLLKAMSQALSIDPVKMEIMLDQGTILLLLDGFNEASSQQQSQLVTELRQIFLRFEEFRCAVGSRKFAVDLSLGMQVFELLPFETDEIVSYVKKALPKEVQNCKLIASLADPYSKFGFLAKNPLLLAMICRVSVGGDVPANRAKVLKVFVSWLFRREATNLPELDGFYESVLSKLAVAIKDLGSALLPQERVVNVIQRELRELNSGKGIFEVISELLTTNFLKRDSENRYSFSHELLLEYFAARGLDAYLGHNKLQLVDLADVTQWHEIIRTYVGLLDDPFNPISRIIDRNPMLAVRCITSSGVEDKTLEYKIVKRCRKILGNAEQKAHFESLIIALLELGAEFGLKTIVNFPRGYGEIFNRALWNCERPEQVCLRLLRYTSTGRDRLYSCLVALKGRKLSRHFLESPEYTRAQSLLLKNPIEEKYIEVLEHLEVLPALKPDIENLLASPGLFNRKPATVASCLRIASKVGLELASVDSIRRIFRPDDQLSGQQAYSVSVLLAGLGKTPQTVAAAIEYATQCLQNGFIALGCKIAMHFSVTLQIEDGVVQESIKRAVVNGKIGQYLSLLRTFAHSNVREHLLDITKYVINKKSIELLSQHLDSLSHPASMLPADLNDAVIRESHDCRLSHKLLSKVIKACGIESVFVDTWSVTSTDHRSETGYMKNLVTNEICFFEFSQVEVRESLDLRYLAKNRLISGAVRNSSSITKPIKLVRGKLL
jgi:hypothetical protein